MLLFRNMGKTHVYNLNESSVIVKDMLRPLFAKEDKILDNVIATIKRKVTVSKIKKMITSIALFGSVNVRKDHPTSDIDIVVIVENTKAKKIAERLFEEIDKKIFEEFGNMLSPYINTRAEFKEKTKKVWQLLKIFLNPMILFMEKG